MKAEINLWYYDKESKPITTIRDNPKKATVHFIKLLKSLGYPSLQPLIDDINKIGESAFSNTKKSREDKHERDD